MKVNGFFEKVKGAFKHIDVQNEGQPDAISESEGNPYELDFKLLDSQTAIQAESILRRRLCKVKDGITIDQPPKVRDGSVDTTIISALLKSQSLDDLIKISEGNNIEESTEKTKHNKDIRNLLQKMEVQKNLMLFYPYYFKTNMMDTINAEEEINKWINSRFGSLIQYRYWRLKREETLNYQKTILEIPFDTYFVTIVDGQFAIYTISSRGIPKLIDKISCTLINSFEKLMELTSSFNNIMYN